MQALQSIGFNPTKGDILISVGDLVDRGPDSIKTLELIQQPWFFAVAGNHEQMMLSGIAAIEGTGESIDLWNWQKLNGGDWYQGSKERKGVAEELLKKVAHLPFAIEVSTDEGNIGVIHASVPNDSWIDEALLNTPEGQKHVLWNRERAFMAKRILESNCVAASKVTDEDLKEVEQEFPSIEGIDRVVVGHTIMPSAKPIYLGNTLFLDVGAAKGELPAVICAKDLLMDPPKWCLSQMSR